MQKLYTAIVALVLAVLPVAGMAADDGVPRIAKEALKAKIEKGEQIVILDVRTGMSYKGSDVKIKGALRIPPEAVEMRYKELPMDKEIITYCT